jgi:hypothetical protein
MKHIPVDVSQLTLLVVGQPVSQIRDGQPYRDRDWDLPMYNIDVTVIGGDGAETIRLSVPEGGFPKELSIGVIIVPEQLVVVNWEKNGNKGQIIKCRAIKVQGGSSALKAAA